jgi:hypothetical protein
MIRVIPIAREGRDVIPAASGAAARKAHFYMNKEQARRVITNADAVNFADPC